MNDVLENLGLRRVINAAGTMTALGAAAVPPEVVAAAAAILPRFVEMAALQDAASRAIARATGAEAGCVTACAAAGISVSLAAAMTGEDAARAERLPDTEGLRNEVVLQKGHNCHFSGEVGQMVRLTGARLLEIGAVNRATLDQLRGALNEYSAAALYVVSHQTAPTGMIPLPAFVETCHAAGVPVIVDAAAEYDLRGFLGAGADVVLYSAHKFLGGLTAGIVAGRADMVRACRLQEQGIGRPMKVGKEAIVATIAALERWEKLDKAALCRAELARSELAARRLAGVEGITVGLEVDPTANPITRARLRIDVPTTGLAAAGLARRLRAGSPAIYVRDHDSDPESLLLDPCTLSDAEMGIVCDRIIEILAEAVAAPSGIATDRMRRA